MVKRWWGENTIKNWESHPQKVRLDSPAKRLIVVSIIIMYLYVISKKNLKLLISLQLLTFKVATTEALSHYFISANRAEVLKFPSWSSQNWPALLLLLCDLQPRPLDFHLECICQAQQVQQVVWGLYARLNSSTPDAAEILDLQDLWQHSEGGRMPGLPSEAQMVPMKLKRKL